MKVSESKIREVVEILKRRGATRVIVFGSYAVSPSSARDLDLGVEGIPLSRLGAAELEVFRVLKIPFDLISREETPEFFELIARDSRRLI